MLFWCLKSVDHCLPFWHQKKKKSVLEFGCWLAFPQVCMCWDRPITKYWSICLPLKHGNGLGNLAFVYRVLWEGKAMSWLTGNTPHLVSRIHVSPLVTGGQMKQRGKSVRSGEAEVTWALGFLSTWQSQVACTVTDGGEPALTHPPSPSSLIHRMAPWRLSTGRSTYLN